jgi:hypothetical protein
MNYAILKGKIFLKKKSKKFIFLMETKSWYVYLLSKSECKMKTFKNLNLIILIIIIHF